MNREFCLRIGYDAVVIADKVICVAPAESGPARRSAQEAKREGRLVDATAGRRARSNIHMEGSLLVLSALTPETLKLRLNGEATPADADLEPTGENGDE